MTEECGIYAITILIICIHSLAVTMIMYGCMAVCVRVCVYPKNMAFAREKDTILGA